MRILPELFLTFAKIGAFTFGGGYAMISLLDHECIEKKQWITSDELMDVTVVAESTPGPIAINCATYTGYKQAGLAGAIAATVGMVLPSFLVILLISTFFESLLSYPLVANAFRGIRIAVAVLIMQAAVKMIKKMLKKTPSKSVSIAFVAAFFVVALVFNLLGIHFSTIYLILIAGTVSFCLFTLPNRKGGQK
ncbi:chromate transporter [[Clostridium] symbiosum]|uniref:chromate transporter n=1 Tax=Clostridium symbiosum TaxID=1512 RepID=UPI001D091C06|nr:chromate transporter [[Clostridium] symbiosum]MCB6607130.1 chromate transporter [[Clostridium] symbiosum]MCB6929690.1 chromate transporter [[Clostridium] symbiosum]